MGERDAADVLNENREARLFPPNGHNPARPPCCHSPQRPAVISAASLLSFPRFLAGIQSEQAFSRIQSGVISLWQGEHDL